MHTEVFITTFGLISIRYQEATSNASVAEQSRWLLGALWHGKGQCCCIVFAHARKQCEMKRKRKRSGETRCIRYVCLCVCGHLFVLKFSQLIPSCIAVFAYIYRQSQSQGPSYDQKMQKSPFWPYFGKKSQTRKKRLFAYFWGSG